MSPPFSSVFKDVVSTLTTLFHRLLQQVLHCATDHAGELIHCLSLGLVDVVDPLLVHLDGSEANGGYPGQLRLGQASVLPQLFQPAFRQFYRSFPVHRLKKLGDIHLVVYPVSVEDGLRLSQSKTLDLSVKHSTAMLLR